MCMHLDGLPSYLNMCFSNCLYESNEFNFLLEQFYTLARKRDDKVLKGTHLLVAVNEIQAGYLISPHFKDLYLYLTLNKLPSTKSAIQKVETLAEKYILLDSLLFKLVATPKKEIVLLAVLETCADKIITLNPSHLFPGHQDVKKIYLTIGDEFCIPGLIHYLKSYLKGVIFVNCSEMTNLL